MRTHPYFLVSKVTAPLMFIGVREKDLVHFLELKQSTSGLICLEWWEL